MQAGQGRANGGMRHLRETVPAQNRGVPEPKVLLGIVQAPGARHPKRLLRRPRHGQLLYLRETVHPGAQPREMLLVSMHKGEKQTTLQ
jgi:hypothetical protein